MVHTGKLQETWEDAVRRLAQKARESGVRLCRDPQDGRHYASSVSQPGQWHYVTGYSCDCAGFVSHGRCMHHSALMVALGWVEDDHAPEPEPIRPRVVTCPDCHGLGTEPGTVADGRGGWRYDNVPCARCHGTGQDETPRAA